MDCEITMERKVFVVMVGTEYFEHSLPGKPTSFTSDMRRAWSTEDQMLAFDVAFHLYGKLAGRSLAVLCVNASELYGSEPSDTPST